MNREMKNVPLAPIACMSFCPMPKVNHLAVGSWDSKIRVYDVDNNSMLMMEDHGSAVLGAAYLDAKSGPPKVAGAGLAGTITLYDISAGRATPIGSHAAGLRCLTYHPPSGLLYSAGWDGQVKAWDSRVNTPISTATLRGKALAMDSCATRLVLTDSTKATYIYDISQPGLSKLVELREQILKFQTRNIKCCHDGSGFIASSVEGRVAWEYFDPSPDVQAKKYSFKCHRVKEPEGEIIHPVHALAVHPGYGTFATGGGEGSVSVWDGFSKKRIWRLPTFRTSVAELRFNSVGDQLAIAVADVLGDRPSSPPNQLILRNISPHDVKPKSLA